MFSHNKDAFPVPWGLYCLGAGFPFYMIPLGSGINQSLRIYNELVCLYQNLADGGLRWRLSWRTCDRRKIDTIECLSCCGLAASLKSISISEYSDIGWHRNIFISCNWAIACDWKVSMFHLIQFDPHREPQDLIVPNSAQLWNGETTKLVYSELILRCHSMTFCQFQWDSMILYVFDDHDDHDDHVVACVIPSPCS